MSDWQETPGHWQASDGKWYPPETHPDYEPPVPPGPPTPPGGYEAPAYQPTPSPSQPPQAPQSPPTTSPLPPSPTAPPPAPHYPPAGPPGAPPPQAPTFLPPGPPSSSPATITAPPPLPNQPVAATSSQSGASKPWYQQPWVLVLGVLLAIAGLVGYATSRGGDDSAVDPTPRSTAAPSVDDEPTTDASAAGSDPAADASTSEAAAPNGPAALAGGESSCTYLGIDSFEDMQVLLQFTYEGAATDLIVTYGIFAPDGARIATANELIELARPGESFSIEADSVENVPAGLDPNSAITCDITTIESFGFAGEPTLPGPDDGCRVVEIDSFGDIQVEVMVTNPFAETRELFVPLALRSNGVRFGDGTAFLDPVGPGEVVRESSDTLTDLPDGLDLEDVQCELLQIESFG